MGVPLRKKNCFTHHRDKDLYPKLLTRDISLLSAQTNVVLLSDITESVAICKASSENK